MHTLVRTPHETLFAGDQRWLRSLDDDVAEPFHLVVLSFVGGVDEGVADLRTGVDPGPTETCVIRVRAGARRSATTVEHPTESVRRLTVGDPSDLSQVGLTLDKYLSETGADAPLVVCLDSISAVAENGDDRAERFVEILTDYLDDRDARGYFHLSTDPYRTLDASRIEDSLDRTVDVSGPDPDPTADTADAPTVRTDGATDRDPSGVRTVLDTAWQAVSPDEPASPASSAPESVSTSGDAQKSDGTQASDDVQESETEPESGDGPEPEPELHVLMPRRGSATNAPSTATAGDVEDRFDDVTIVEADATAARSSTDPATRPTATAGDVEDRFDDVTIAEADATADDDPMEWVTDDDLVDRPDDDPMEWVTDDDLADPEAGR
jgi:hypothetical protein